MTIKSELKTAIKAAQQQLKQRTEPPRIKTLTYFIHIALHYRSA